MWAWVPQVYYDVLGRVIPGAALALGVVFVRHGPVRGVGAVLQIVCEQDQSWVCRLGIGVLAAYFIGLVLGEVGELVAGRALERRDADLEYGAARECLEEHSSALEAAGGSAPGIPPSDLPSTAIMREQLKVAAPNDATRLLKLRAERRLCLVLVFGLSLLAVFNIIAFSGDLIGSRLVYEGLIVVLALVFWRRSTRLHRQLVIGTCHAWLMNVARGALQAPAR